MTPSTVGLTIQRQLQTNWCWAACSSSTSEFFDPSSPWAQCRIASAELGQQSCCENGASAGCNRPWYLDRALARTGNLAGRQDGPASWSVVLAEIQSRRPVGARIGWRDGGGHFVLIVGCEMDPSPGLLAVEDPWTGGAIIQSDEFTHRYQSIGTWTHTYLTRR